MKLLASFVWGILLSVTVIASSFGGTVSLPWSSSLNCAAWTYDGSYNVTPPSGCSEFIVESTGSACGTRSAMLPAANRSGSAGNGIRQLVASGVNIQTTGFDINFGAQSSVWIRWYQRYQAGFSWNTLNYHKDIYLVDYVNNGSHQYVIPEPYGSTYRVAWWNGTKSDALYANTNAGWSTIGDGNWHLYELHVTQSGTIQMWIDQVQIINGQTGAAFPYTWGLVLFGSNASDVRSNCYAVDYDDLAISNTGYIGPASGSSTPATYTITASAGTGGSISPSGATTVSTGGSRTFTITPASGQTISSVVVDGASAGAVSTYTFSNVTANHTIAATFATAPSTTYTITASAGAGGSISPSGTTTVSRGAGQTYTITPASGQTISSVVVDGASAGAVSTYTFSNVTANHTIAAAFSATSTPPPSSSLLLYEGFEDLSWSSRGWYDNTSHGLLATSGCYSGKCLRWSWAQGATTPSNGGAVRRVFTPSEEIFLRYYLYVDSNWQGSGLSYQPHMLQILSDKDAVYQGPAYANLDAYFEVNGNPPSPIFVIQDAVLINTTQGTPPVNLAGITENRALAGCNGDFGDPGTSVSCYQNGSWFNGRTWKSGATLAKGSWHMVEYYLKMNTISDGRANPDGTLRIWVNGNLTTSKSNMAYRTNQQPTKKWTQLLLGPYMGSGSPIAQNMYIDELSIYNANQKSDGTPIAPAVPAGLTIGP